MATTVVEAQRLDDRVRAKLNALRWRIRIYVLLESLALAVIWLCVSFWVTLALDYLPILVGASEMPRAARAVCLAIVAGGLAFILYWWLLRRSFVRLADHSMAVLIERHFDRFHDSLVTSVEMKERPDHAKDFNPEMLQHADHEAVEAIANVRLSEVFNSRPIAWKLVVASLAAFSVLLFGTLQADAMDTWTRRNVLLDDEPWPRRARIEVVGVEVVSASAALGADSAPARSLPFTDGQVKVARGSTVRLQVRAFADAPQIPDTCTIYYRTDDGERGRVTMQKVGRIRNERIDGRLQGVQSYTFDGKPFSGILSSIDFEVVGLDHRVGSYRVEVVESPALAVTRLAAQFPDYLVNEQLGAFLPRTIDYRSGTQLPEGTRVTVEAEANKDLVAATVYDATRGEETTMTFDPQDGVRQFAYELPPLNENTTLEITLHDVDDVISERPERLVLIMIPDQPPQVQVLLQGIGTAVTPMVVVPARGRITDDYEVAEAWWQVEKQAGNQDEADNVSRTFPLPLPGSGEVEAELDFRQLRSAGDPLQLEPGNQLVLSIEAIDHYDLAGEPNVGRGDSYQLEVVTPETLLSILDRQEYGMRMRFEQIISELHQTRDDLMRVKADRAAHDQPAELEGAELEGAEPEESNAIDLDALDDDAQTPQQRAQQRHSLQLLRSQRAQMQSEKSAQEINGVAMSFLDIRRELINNRVDTEDRKERLKTLIADPLLAVVENEFPEFDERLKTLESSLQDPQSDSQAVDAALDQLNEILLQLDSVLQQMLEIEGFNELVAEVRSMLESQEALLEETKQQQERQVLQDLFD